MKKFIYIVAIPLGVISIILMILFLAKNNTRVVNTTECPKLTKSQLSSERSLGLIIENRRLLAVRLKDVGEKNYSPPGGHVEVGETYPQALQRELQEEINLKIDQADLTQLNVTCEPRYGSIERTYYYLVNKWNGTISVDNQADDLKWVNYSYHSNKNADTELKTALLYLKEGNLID